MENEPDAPACGSLRYADTTLKIEIDTHSRDCESASRLSRLLGIAGLVVAGILVLLTTTRLLGNVNSRLGHLIIIVTAMYAGPGLVLLACAELIRRGSRPTAMCVFIASVLAQCALAVAIGVGIYSLMNRLLSAADLSVQIVAPALFLVGFGTLTAQTYRLFARGGAGKWADEFDARNLFRPYWLAARLPITGRVFGAALLVLGCVWVIAAVRWTIQTQSFILPAPVTSTHRLPRGVVMTAPLVPWDGDVRSPDGLDANDRAAVISYMTSNNMIPAGHERSMDLLLRRAGKSLLGKSKLETAPNFSSVISVISIGSRPTSNQTPWRFQMVSFGRGRHVIQWVPDSTGHYSLWWHNNTQQGANAPFVFQKPMEILLIPFQKSLGISSNTATP